MTAIKTKKVKRSKKKEETPSYVIQINNDNL